MSGSTTRVGVIGTTSWGTTLAVIMARRGIDVRLLARTETEAGLLERARENRRFVPGAKFPESLTVTASAAEAVDGAGLAIIAVPSRSFRANLRAAAPAIGGATVVVSATKGLEVGTCLRMSEVLAEELPGAQICSLSGPNLAREIIDGKPTSTVAASSAEDPARQVQDMLNSSTLRVYTNSDIVGVELGGALKNIIAIGAGICDGMTLGDNAKAAFLTRGLTEITRLGVAAGASPMTLAGLSGMGDLIATCSSTLSRNHYVGEQLAAGRSLTEIRSSMTNVAEGVDTTAAAMELARRLRVEMPITRATFDILFNDVAVDQAVSALLVRAPTPEWT